MEMEKKNLAIIILAIVLAASGIGNIILGIQLGFIEVAPPSRETLIRATGSGPADLDPVDSWDSASNDVIRQVCEPLFFYNLSDPELPQLNWLCDTYTWEDEVTLEVNIRTGIKFHDGTVMDAEAVAWNFDRLIYLNNHTGEMPSGGHRAKIHSLYEFPDGSPVINKTIVVDTDTLQIVLNDPYTQILAAMAYASCDILSPTATPFDEFLDKATDDLVGTGPYMYDYYIADTEVRFTRWDEYWGSPADTGPAYFEVMIFDVIDDSVTRNYAMLAGDCDILSGSMADLFDDFRASPAITFYESSTPGLGISYLGMNNDVFTEADGDADDAAIGVNVTWRKAITFAINNTYMIHEMYDDQMLRAYCWISPGYGNYFDPNLPGYAGTADDDGDYVRARQVIWDDLSPVSADIFGRDPNTAADWQVDDEDDTDRIITFNYSYNTDNWFRADLYDVLLEWLGEIGIFVEDGGTDWAYFLYRAYGYVPGGYDQLQIYWVGWGPDYLDPMNMIQPLISNASQANSAQVNDPTVEALITEYNTNTTLSESEKKWIIWNLTFICSQVLYCHVYGFHAKVFAVHAADLFDIPYNIVGNFWAYPISRFNYSAYVVEEE